MGEKGRSIVDVNVKELIEDLNKAYADEWLAAYWFWLSAQIARGVMGHEVAEEFEDAVEEELGHAESLAQRILQLGGMPVMDPADLPKVAFSKYQVPPTNRSDAAAFLKQAIETEREAIAFYHALAKKVRDKDPVTWLLVSEILRAEVEDEEKYERYLGKL
jgi:bacterioferritin